MKVQLSRLSLLNSIILFTIAMILAFSTIWGLKELRAPYLELDKLSTLNERFVLNVVRPIEEYLNTGDATKLTEATQGIEVSLTSSEILSEAAKVTLQEKLTELSLFLDGDFRAAGKLSGDPQALLLQNERETRDELSLITRYALDGYNSDPIAATRYIKLATSLLEYVHAQALNRQAYFETFSQAKFEEIRSSITSAKNDAESMRALPLLGVFEEAEDDFGLSLGDSKEEAEDKGVSLRDNIGYLLDRYIAEIDQTRDIISKVSDSRASLRTQLSEIKLIFEQQADSISTLASTSYATVRTVLFGTVIAIVVFALLIDVVQRSIIKRIRELVPYLEEYAAGDFRRPINVNAMTLEVQSLSDSSNKLRESLSSLVGDVQTRIAAVNDISHSLELLAREVDSRCSEQQNETGTISVSIEQMNASFNEVAQSAASAAEAASLAESAIGEGNQRVQGSVSKVRALVQDVKKTAESVSALQAESENIDSIINVIDGIAEQTNLLALNATIEAARAGEQGRGFAVVADEVRSLSLRTSESTKEIKTSIERLQTMTRQAVEIMQGHSEVADNAATETESAGAQLNETVSEITRMKQMNSQIAVATEQQSSVAADISSNIQRIRVMSSDTSEQAALTQSQVLELLDEANSLIASANLFVIKDNAPS
ncbi:hypothetical protein A3742_15300 [Oleiphilus sp. HI0071]|nr:hypothetical protein A3737_06970 [Oleiphilus sp. HI0065]KZY78019.1 hypothetical protein A3742_15300 [Oleiphilus sp. HI0071]KZY90120.1 hypothetical protein A3744_05735 [Oleiphilus sp. HI0073]KZZ18733.1 hypothetical protein A3751_01010 [Oleiphilus sp. HI0080]KZZ44789.1 hypothetical protein A3758_02220 [Oleiphilus sp. HI0118]KZZ50335.1 hypothetical protein A3760_02255 [Oleiphilus sp. HI0122]KZZ78866.1 hypothetical protein A3767_01415 [Oleiphilus sp. HI0133]